MPTAEPIPPTRRARQVDAPSARGRRPISPRRRQRLRRTLALTAVALGLTVTVGATVLNRVLSWGPSGCEVVNAEGARFPFGADQMASAATIVAVAVRRELPARAAVVAVATAMQESKLRNLDHGDRDSLGLFQQRPSQGWGAASQVMDPVYASGAFYDHLLKVRGWQAKPLAEAAQAVQRSAFPAAYARHEVEAKALAEAYSGTRPEAVTCELDASPLGLSAAQVALQVRREWGVPARLTDREVTVDVLSPTRAWALAQWALAHAEHNGIVAVAVADRTWQRGSRDHSWRPANALDPGQVRITLGQGG